MALRSNRGPTSSSCEVGELPGDASETYYVRHAEFANAPLSHHLIVSAAEPGSPADQKLREHALGDQVPCLNAETAFGSEGMYWAGGTQQPYNEVRYPRGVGREYHGGQRVVFDYHYFNTTLEPIEARSAFNFHLGKAQDIEHIARRSEFINYTIDTPARGTGKFTGECRFKQDVMLGTLIRHTHRWGTDYSVWFEGGARHGEHVWTSTDWARDRRGLQTDPRLHCVGLGGLPRSGGPAFFGGRFAVPDTGLLASERLRGVLSRVAAPDQSSICVPTSITRSGGIPKNEVAG